MWCITTHTQDQISGLCNFIKEEAVTEIFVPTKLTAAWEVMHHQ
jgi:hypothetical protein